MVSGVAALGFGSVYGLGHLAFRVLDVGLGMCLGLCGVERDDH